MRHLILKERTPKEAPTAKLKISPTIKLLFSYFEKLFDVADFWEVGNKSATSVDAVVGQVYSEG